MDGGCNCVSGNGKYFDVKIFQSTHWKRARAKGVLYMAGNIRVMKAFPYYNSSTCGIPSPL